MVKQGDVITLTENELQKIIQRECKKRLGLTVEEFLRRRKLGELRNSTAAHDIEMLLKLA